MSGADPDLPYHLGADASKDCVGGVLFQLHGCTPDEQIMPRNRSKMKIIMFLSFRLTDAETRYSNTERECLSIVWCLAETKWLVIGSKYPIKIYTDHEALPPVLTKGTELHGQIATWQDRLNEYDTEVYHRPCTDPMIGIADGLSRLPKGLATDFIPDDAPRMTMPILPDDWTKQSEEKKLAPAYDGQGWEKFNQLPELISELRALQHWATKFSLGEQTGVLLYTERNGARAPCIVGEEIPAILGHLHDGHGHYSHIITLDRLIGEAYWPTRAHDVITWCRSCQACQVRGPKQGKGAMKHILELEPMSMVGLDFLGPINPSCNTTNHKYILLAIDYFTRFMWMEKAIYSDNGSHFTGQEINTIFQSHGVTHYTAPVTHPSSVGLIERNVQLVLSQLRARCIAAGTPGSWSRYIPEIALSINTRLIQVHGYSPAELLLGYKPKLAHFNIQPLKLPIWMDEMEAEATRTYGLYVALREETRNQATESLATHQGKNEAKRAIPLGLLSPGDLVLVRDTQLDNQRGRKLEARWRGQECWYK
ncbi:Ribonuclease H-like domain [Lasallia pustulata]|uniref:Ribonuclease H-like domain n=1 Tax=Lasallia pustulata TaxID=136370 RepID=A0A1W5D3J7_9LECA|nr:Ribonuclease H-like domain [Lasallia pustulata]